MFLTKRHLSRRTFLRGAGVTLGLPLLESMVPAATALAQTAANPKTRLCGIYIPHGATMDKWTPPAPGTGFQFSEILQPLEPFRNYVNVVSDLGHAPVAPWTGEDTGGAENHVRAAAVFLSGAHPVKKNEAYVGATIDQIAAQHVGQDTPLPSVELSMEPVNLTCGDAGFTCAYRNTLSWKSATLPLPMENNPQLVFERLFGDGRTGATRRAVCSTRSATRSPRWRRTCRPAIAASCASISTRSERSSAGSGCSTTRCRAISICPTRRPVFRPSSSRTSS